MGIQGFLDAVDPMQIRGWAYDVGQLGKPVSVRAMLDGVAIVEGKANLFREDLEQAGLGDGFHAFILNLDRKLNSDEIERVYVEAALEGEPSMILDRAEPLPDANDETTSPASDHPSRTMIAIEESHSDESQRPVFILGAARSGTTAMAQGLLKSGVFEGNQEGHVFDLLAHFSVALRKYYDFKSDDAFGGRDTTLSRVPKEFFRERLDADFIAVAAKLFPTGRWLDKTPNSDMIFLAPRFKKMWPNARFIFMRRRFLENAASRSRKYPEFEFEHHAMEWSRAMEAWLQAKPHLQGAAIEIDQRFLSEQPEKVANELAGFLSLTGKEEIRLAQALRYDQPERTAAGQWQACDLSDMGWGEAEQKHFAQYCGKLMNAFGYSVDANYYRAGFEDNGLVIV